MEALLDQRLVAGQLLFRHFLLGHHLQTLGLEVGFLAELGLEVFEELARADFHVGELDGCDERSDELELRDNIKDDQL